MTNPYIVELEWEDKPDATVEGTDVTGSAQGANANFRYWAPFAREREFDFVKDYVRVIYEPHEDALKLYMSMLAHQQEHFTNTVYPDLSKTVVTMTPEDSDPSLANENQAFDS